MRILLLFSLGLLTIWSAISVVGARHESRKLFVELQRIEKQRDQMLEGWGRLQLEQATWGTYSRIEEVAREKLKMKLPPTEEIKLVTK